MKTLCSILASAIALACGPVFAADEGKNVTPRVSKDKAQAAALQAVPGDVLRWDLQVADGIPEYAFYIKGKDGRISEVEMDGNTGKKTHVGKELRSGVRDGKEITTTNTEDLSRIREAKLTQKQAQEKALKAYPGSVEGWELLIWETGDEGTIVYEFRIAAKSGRKVVAINAKTGAIVSISTFVDGSRI